MTEINRAATDRAATDRATLRRLPAPEPAAGLAAYERERDLCLGADPRRRANYERYRKAMRRAAEPDYLPIKLDIENVSRCNLRCTMCPVSLWPKGRRAGDLSLEVFRQLIDEQVGLVEIKLQGMGEPLLQRDPFFDMIRYARARHIWVRTTTNASLLHLNDNAAKLVAADPNEVQVSIDGADTSIFKRIRRGAMFDAVTRNCADLNARFEAAGKTRTKMWTVVQQANLHQLEDLVQLAARLGFRHQAFSLELTDWGLDHWRLANAEVSAERDLDPERLAALIELGRSLGMTVAFWNITEKYVAGDPSTLCPWPFERAFLSSDHRVVPCCTIGNPDVLEIGAPGKSTREIWTGPDYAAFRRAHLNGRVPEPCRACYAEAVPA